MPIVSLPARTGTNWAISAFEIWNYALLKTNEIRQFGKYHAQRLVLEAWDRLFGGRL